MEKIKLIEKNQEIILNMIIKVGRKNGKYSSTQYLIEKWLELEFEKDKILKEIEETKQKEDKPKQEEVYATKEELEKIVKELQREGDMSFEKVVTGFMYGKIKLKDKRINVEHIFDIIEEHDRLK